MKKHLFLTGPASCGKSALLRELLGPALAMAGGYATKKAYGKDGALEGIDLYPAAAAGGVSGFSPARIVDLSCQPPKTDNEVFRSLGVRLLQEAVYYPFVFLDEIGGFELIIPQFRSVLEDLLSSDQPCIGVVKTLEDAEAMRRELGLSERYRLNAQRLHEVLAADPETIVCKMTSGDNETARRIVSQWAREYVFS
ncbi:MAG: hypothetical protein J5927_06120 [Oscillospiraceae bacterium]|nr:hypothetical protein [Oscillospiraceae bacterium]